ncbi:MAG: DUF3536 domain-containing protein [Chloroflexi bacterium]|nr:MAG: DUF3536 domain-containing protein [Chloroflexota bacterium]
MTRYLCVHGHFYQPPRENPWLDAIDVQPSAAPYHDWNARIAAECYAPNTAARILDERGRIRAIINNYARISFNVGPTLMRWLKQHETSTYAAILAADRESQMRFGGHGSAIAQVYGHIIMPLASARYRRTQVAWGVADFLHHYGRMPEGMWLSEAAVCTDSLEALAEHGIKYTILAPHQAAAVRRIGATAWEQTTYGVDTTMPYRINLPSGRSIAVFFYNGATSQAIAFQNLLQNGDALANALLRDAADDGTPRLAHVATDGETYGHHHRHGEMALAFALANIEKLNLAKITVYGEYLALHPPTHEAQIVENSSWSCAHGVERWRSNCGCHTGGQPGWTQTWRAPLRASLDYMADAINAAWYRKACEFYSDPWAARDAYIAVINQPDEAGMDAFMKRHGLTAERWPALGLMELQRQLMQSFTSCAWFFNDPTGIETIQVLRYAARAMQLAQQTLDVDIEEGFNEQLEKVISNTGVTLESVYRSDVSPLVLSLADVCAHDALTALFHDANNDEVVYLHRIRRVVQHLWTLGTMRIAIGVTEVTALLTGEQRRFQYGVVLTSDQIMHGGVRPDNDNLDALLHVVVPAVAKNDQVSVKQAMDDALGPFHYSLHSVFREEQRSILESMLAGVVDKVVARYHQMYAEHTTLMRFLQKMSLPVPEELQVASSSALHADVRSALANDPPESTRVQALLDDAQLTGVVLDRAAIALQMSDALARVATRVVATPFERGVLGTLLRLVDVAEAYDVDMWMVQNNYNVLWQRDYPTQQRNADAGDVIAMDWVADFRNLGEHLNMAIVNE